MMSAWNDATLVRALQEGSKEAFSEIYRRYSRILFLQAYQKIGVKEICEDLLQDVFSALWTKKLTISPHYSLKAYLEGMLRHKVIDYYRLSCQKLRHLDALTEMLDKPEAPLAEIIQTREQESFLKQHVQSMSEGMRTIFQLSRYEGLSVEDISQHLQLSNQTVRNQISRALKALRLKWQDTME
jgi:RNA polymerase sigma-70 factor (ECF subfamily)